MQEYNFSISGTELLSFIRDEFADFAIESYKIEKDRSLYGKEVLSLCILDILAFLHPYAPHITEMLYGFITGGKSLSQGDWPQSLKKENPIHDMSMERIWSIIRIVRNLRAESGVKPGELRDVILVVPKIYRDHIGSNIPLIR